MTDHFEIVPAGQAPKVPQSMVPVVQKNSAIPTPHELMVYQTMAEQAVSSKMYRGIGDHAGVMMIMLAAREMSIPPMQALNGGLNIIQGKVEISARMMSALIRNARHKVSIKESTDTSCTLVGTRADTGEVQEASFSIAEATKAGLVKPGGGWTKWPKDMCYARALSRLARQLFSDVVLMGYVEGEIINVVPEQVTHVHEVESIEVEKIEDLTDYTALFPQPDKDLAIQYLEAVKKNFGWDDQVALKNLINKPNLLDTFNEWKKRLNG